MYINNVSVRECGVRVCGVRVCVEYRWLVVPNDTRL